MATPTHRRALTNEPTPVDLPDPIGSTTLRYLGPGLTWVELELDPYLDRLNARLERRGEEPFESTWEALEELTLAYPMAVMPLLLKAGLRHHGPGVAELVDELDPAVYHRTDVADAANVALSIAFGHDPAELPSTDEETDPADPTLAGDDAGGSTGEPSTPSGPAPSTPEG